MYTSHIPSVLSYLWSQDVFGYTLDYIQCSGNTFRILIASMSRLMAIHELTITWSRQP